MTGGTDSGSSAWAPRRGRRGAADVSDALHTSGAPQPSVERRGGSDAPGRDGSRGTGADDISARAESSAGGGGERAATHRPPAPARRDPDATWRSLTALTTRALGRPADIRATVTSTNDLALDAADAGAPHGHLVVADAQTGGRGRRGRAWHSPPGVAIYASLVLRGERALDSANALVAAIGLGLAEGIEAAAPVTVGIKWPNDLWIDGRKVAGILVEARGFRVDGPVLVAGFGLNVLQAPADFPPDVRDSATSLAMVTGRSYDRGAILRAVLEALEPRVDDALGGRPSSELRAAYRARSVLLGRRVELTDADRPFVGVVADLSATDGLVLRTDDGAHRHVPAEFVRDVRPI